MAGVNSTDRALGQDKNYNAVFTDKKDNSMMDPDSFLKLMAAQMQNQDFMNPMDDAQFVTQMATFSNMQQMQEMAAYSKTNYAMGLVGKTVTASRFNVSGDLDSTTGPVQKVSLVDDGYVLYIDGKKYELSQIMEIQGGKATGDDAVSVVDPTKFALKADEVTADSAVITWEVPTEDETVSKELKYNIYYSKEAPLDTVEKTEAAQRFGAKDFKGEPKETLTGLEPDTTYYVNVVVTDPNGVKTIYKPLTVKTKT